MFILLSIYKGNSETQETINNLKWYRNAYYGISSLCSIIGLSYAFDHDPNEPVSIITMSCYFFGAGWSFAEGYRYSRQIRNLENRVGERKNI